MYKVFGDTAPCRMAGATLHGVEFPEDQRHESAAFLSSDSSTYRRVEVRGQKSCQSDAFRLRALALKGPATCPLTAPPA